MFYCPGSAQADVIAPGNPIAGQSQLGHAHQWWNTMSNIPAGSNPLLDSTGANAPLAQVGSVLYLGGSFVSGSVNRTITVEPGTSLFFPVVNGFADNTAAIGSPPTTLTAQQLLDIIFIPNATVQNLFLEIDGQPVLNTADLLTHRQTTDPNNPFTNVIQSEQNLLVDFGFDPTLGTGDPLDPASYPTPINPTVLDGFWVGISPFGHGTLHTVRFGGTIENHPTFGNFSLDITYNVITTPEPTSLLVWGGIISGLVLTGRYRRRRKGEPEPAPSA
jgi:hypothetical protein